MCFAESSYLPIILSPPGSPSSDLRSEMPCNEDAFSAPVDNPDRVKAEVCQYVIYQFGYFMKKDPIFCAQFPLMCRVAYEYGKMCKNLLGGLQRMKRPSKKGKLFLGAELRKALAFTVEECW